jgi:uncharacterized protein
MSELMAGSLLREARRRAHLSQVELAGRAGITQSVVSAYESGSRQPSLPTLARLVTATGLDLDVRVRRSRSPLSRLNGPLGRRLRQHRRQVQGIAAEHGLSNVRVFGSVARGADTTDSDIDLLVDVASGVSLLGLARCQQELEWLLEVPVDLVPAEDLKPDVAHTVQVNVIALWAVTTANGRLPGLTPHDLRHTAASLAVQADANVKAVQRMLGHASAAMTLDVYAGLFGDDLDAVADRLDEAAVRARADSLRTRGHLRTISGPDESGENAVWPAEIPVGRAGLEPATQGLWVPCSNLLSYRPSASCAAAA